MTGARGDKGSASIEAAVGVPAFVLFVGLIILGGRTATTHQALESASSDAARAASIARTAAEATAAAEKSARSSLANQQIDCIGIQVDVNTEGFQVAAGQAASIGVTVTCRLDLSDLTVPGVPGSRSLRATITSPIDTWRERSS